MSEHQTMSDKVLSRLRMILARTTDAGFTEAEAASAQAKASEILAAHNMSMTDIELSGGDTGEGGKRDKSLSARSAMYDWQRDLMAVIAKANFCKHWVEMVVVDDEKSRRGDRKRPAPRHMLIGRQVNVVSANMMYDYLVQTMERLLPYGADMKKSRSAHSWRLGCAIRLRERISITHEEVLANSRREAQDRARRQEAARAAGTVVEANALVLADVFSTEEELNEDAYYDLPAGTTAKNRLAREAKEAKWLADFKARDVVRAPLPPAPVLTDAEKRKKEREDAEWMRRYKAKCEREEAAQRRRAEAAAARIDTSAFHAGASADASISLNKQVDETAKKAIR